MLVLVLVLVPVLVLVLVLVPWRKTRLQCWCGRPESL